MDLQHKDIGKPLEVLLARIEASGLKSLSGEDALAFGRLYRQAAGQLSLERTRGVNHARIAYLNGLVSRGYGYLYVPERRHRIPVLRFFREILPQSVRRNRWFILTACLVTLVSALYAWAHVARDKQLIDVVLGPGAQMIVEDIAGRHKKPGFDWMPADERPVMAGFIITNNIVVAMNSFALGITVGVGTGMVLFQNGLMLGAIGAAISHMEPHIRMGFWSFVAPHGVLEFTAIFMAGGAGFLIAWALLCPGRYTRMSALRRAGQEAALLLLGLAAILVAAGLIEGFISPSQLPNASKLVIAALVAFSLLVYLHLGGREAEAR